MNILEVMPIKNHLLYVKSEDGRAGLLDLSPFFDSEVFVALKDEQEFARVRNGRYFVEWACGADLSADTIEARWSLLKAEDLASSSSQAA